MQASSVLVLLTMRASPTPRSPSSVTSSTKVSSRQGVPTTTVSTPTTFTAPPSRRRLAAGLAGRLRVEPQAGQPERRPQVPGGLLQVGQHRRGRPPGVAVPDPVQDARVLLDHVLDGPAAGQVAAHAPHPAGPQG